MGRQRVAARLDVPSSAISRSLHTDVLALDKAWKDCQDLPTEMERQNGERLGEIVRLTFAARGMATKRTIAHELVTGYDACAC